MNKVDNYLQSRIKITEKMSLQHVNEVRGLCPICGKALLVQKGEQINKNYQIAHIYPNSPTEYQRKELNGLERLGETCEDFKNKIALCKECHGYYDDHTTKQEYLRLVGIKKQLLEKDATQRNIASIDVENELVLIIKKLSETTEEEITDISLKYEGMKITDKLEEKYLLLRQKIKFNVCTYYGFIKENMRNMADEDKLNFEVIASEIRTAYLKAALSSDNKEIIFEALVKWMNSKIPQSSKNGCEIMISFFVQNCEVFDEIS